MRDSRRDKHRRILIALREGPLTLTQIANAADINRVTLEKLIPGVVSEGYVNALPPAPDPRRRARPAGRYELLPAGRVALDKAALDQPEDSLRLRVLRRLSPPHRSPSSKKLADEFGMAHWSAVKVLDELVAAGLALPVQGERMDKGHYGGRIPSRVWTVTSKGWQMARAELVEPDGASGEGQNPTPADLSQLRLGATETALLKSICRVRRGYWTSTMSPVMDSSARSRYLDALRAYGLIDKVGVAPGRGSPIQWTALPAGRNYLARIRARGQRGRQVGDSNTGSRRAKPCGP